MKKKYGDLEDSDYKDDSIESGGKNIQFKTTTVAPHDQEFIKLNEKDKEFITYSLGDADDLLKILDSNKGIDNYTAADLDDLLFMWINKRYDFKTLDEVQFVNAIGSAFGHYMNKECGTIWTVVSDEYGTDYACFSENPNFQTFPFSSVWKAIEQNREGSLESIILLVKEKMKEWLK